jgi:uncharacterized small protein (DUF1192 family)
MEDEYNTRILMPELERRKAEMAKKRDALQPVSHDAIKEHGKRY